MSYPASVSHVLRDLFRQAVRPCLLGLGVLAAFSGGRVQGQYPDWNANPPKILPKERPGAGVAFAGGSGRQCPNVAAFAALKPDGSIVAWGSSDAGGSGAPVGTGFTALYSNERAFAALKADGSITAWGHADQGGSGAPTGTGFTAVYSTREAFAALKADGSITAWGNPSYGGSNAPTGTGYVSLYSNYAAFAALKADGSITAWGNSTYGGGGAPAGTGFTAVYSTAAAFAALKENGSISTWGNGGSGGTNPPSGTGFTVVYSTAHAFAALKAEDGSISAWGNYGGGGIGAPTGQGFTDVYSTDNAFAAVNADGSITAWGMASSGGSGAPTGTGFTAVYSNGGAFAALKEDGSITAWGDSNYGASSAPSGSGYTAIYSNPAAFAALKEDGSISAWGNSSWGGSGAPTGRLFTSVSSNYFAFAALKSDGSISTWGNVGSGGSGGPSEAGFTSVQSVSAIEPLAVGASVSATTGSITSTTATLNGEVVREGLEPVTERGFVYALATVTNPTIGDGGVTKLVDGSAGSGTFSATLSGLTPNTAYVFKSYVIDADVTTYSRPVNFSTNLSPVLTSNGGSSTATVPVAENSSAVTTVSATDADAGQAITYSITGGADAARFVVDSSSGALSFVTAPDFEVPADADADSVYQVIVAATDNGNTPKSATQTLTITVTNLADNGELVLERANGTGLASGDLADFGSQTLGQAADLTFTLRSVGEADLDLTGSALIGGASSSAYSLIGSIPATLATGSSVTFTLRFSPSASGSNPADLRFATNDTRAGRSSHVLNLTGTGLTSATTATYASAASQVRGGWIDGGNFTIGAVGTTNPGNNWPSGESPDKVVDNNTGSKFLIYRNNNAGLIFSPTNAAVAFNRLSLYTANDSSERDPASYVIYGSSTALTGAAGTNIPLAGLTQLASGALTLPGDRTTGPTVVQFANTTPYASYIVAFPTVRSTSGNNLTQISEVQLSQGITPPYAVAMAGARGGQLSGGTFNFGSIGTNNPGTNWKSDESPDQALDGNLSTKYLLFRNTGAGLIVSPDAGPARVNRLSFWTANDFAERDPLTYEVYGFATAVTARSGTLNVATSGTLLGSGTVTLPATRNAGPTTVTFTNSTAYASYLVVFPTVKNSPSTTMMQIAEVQFGYNSVPDFQTPTRTVAAGGKATTQVWLCIASSADGTKLAAAGEDSQLYTSSDSGVTWTAQTNAGTRKWRSIALSADGTKMVAGAYPSQLYTSTDSGVTWTARETSRYWRSVASSSDGTKLAAVVTGGQIYTSTDSGVSWTARATTRKWVSIASSVDGTKLVAAVQDGQLYTSTDSGATWTARESNRQWESVASSADGTKLVAAAESGQLYTSADSGVNWTARESVRSWRSVASSSDGTRLAAVGIGAEVYVSTDSGITWTGREGSRYWSSIASSSDGTKLVAGVINGQIYTLQDVVLPDQVTVAEDSGNFTRADVLTGITPGIGDVGQTVSFAATNDNNALFSVQPAISAEGTLTFTPAANTFGRATVGVIATDSAGLGSSEQTFVIEVTPGAFAASQGSASASQTLALEQSGYTGPVTITAPAGYEVSTDGSDFSSSLSVRRPAGTIQSVYDGDFDTATGVIWGMGSSRQFPNSSAFAALKSDGSVVTWGHEYQGGDSSSVSDQLDSEVSAIYSNRTSFAALKNDGSVVTWGAWETGGNFSVFDDSEGVDLPPVGHVDSGVVEVYSTSAAYAALKSDGSVVTWGWATEGGDSSAVANQLTSGVTAIRASFSSFAALKNDGSVVTWGDADGGNSSSVAAQLTSGVTAVYSNDNAFAAVKSNGSVVTWGDAELGGNSSAVAAKLTSGVRMVQGNMGAFAALKNDGSVVTWGDIYYGGSPAVIDQFANSIANVTAALASGVSRIYSNDYAFAALKDNGSVVTWGYAYTGGDSSSVAARLTSGVTAISSSGGAFAALKSDGSVVTWGDGDYGGDSTGVASSLASGVAAVYSTEYSFAALKTDGSVVTWGDDWAGGDSLSVADQLDSGVIAIYSTEEAYAAVKNDGSVVTWGQGAGGTDGPSNIGVEVPLPATIHVRLASDASLGSVVGNLTLTSIGSSTQTIALSGTVEAAPEAPVLAGTPTSASIATTTATLGGEVTASDETVTGRGVVYALTSANAVPAIGGTGVTQLTTSGTTGSFTVDATGLGANRAYSFRAYAISSAGTSYSGVGTFTTLAVPPSFAGYAATVKQGKTLALSLSKVLARATDPDGGAVTLTEVFGPSAQGGTVSLTGTLNYTPPASFTGTDSFDFELTGSQGGILRATVTVTVTGNTAAGQNQTEIRLHDGVADLTFRGIPGRSYTVQRSTNLTTWTTLATVVAGADGRITYTDPAPPQPSGYYRVQF